MNELPIGGRRLFTFLILAALAGALCAPSARGQDESEEGFTSIFNGVDVTGWTADSGQPLIVADRTLTGNPLGPGMIRTEKVYSDFALRLEFWADRGQTHEANGGIYFRHGLGEPPQAGYEIQISMQDPLNPVGSIFNRAPQNLELMKTIAPEKQWNRVEIRCVGPRTQAWINGEAVQDAAFHEISEGYIALQHHHNGCTIKYRNIRVKELTEADAEEGWRPIFNGENFDGWTSKGAADWIVRDGELVGEGGIGNLYYTESEFQDLEVRAMARVSEKGNAGILFRAHWPEGDPDNWAEGYECQIDNWDAENTTGLKNVTGGIFGRSHAPLLTRDEAWFSLRVRVEGDHIQTFVNGRKVTDFHDGSFAGGYVGLQSARPGTIVQFRDIEIREIAPAAAP